MKHKALVALVLSFGIGASLGSAAADGVGSDRGKTERGETVSSSATRELNRRGETSMLKSASSGDAERGAQLYESRCGGCHSVDSHRIGPMHKGVFGRRAGSAAGYDYSAALKSSKLVWGDGTLDQWLTDPERTIPGQAMGYRVEQPKDRADLIAYLRRL
jgi:cytochrome c